MLKAESYDQLSRRRERVWMRNRELTPRQEPVTPEQVVTMVENTRARVSVVRNPYDFLASCYVRKGRRGQRFEDFVASFQLDPFVVEGRLYYHLDASDEVLRYENLAREFNGFLGRLGLPPIQIERLNVTKDKRPWESYYTPKAFETVNGRFGDEFGQFYDLRTA